MSRAPETAPINATVAPVLEPYGATCSRDRCRADAEWEVAPEGEVGRVQYACSADLADAVQTVVAWITDEDWAD